ncbi:MAG: hypothetical protein ACYC59_04335 [Anaerolineaceae bacterium]
MFEISVFDYVGRSMERLGYLKYLIRRASATPTSNLENLGTDLINTVSKRIKISINNEIYQYAHTKIRADFIKPVQNEVKDWLNKKANAPEINIEIQDLYLSQSIIPSCVGRLVKDNWRRYPALATNLGLLRKGTYSLNTRGFTFLYFTPEEDLKAFIEYSSIKNPMIIEDKLVLLLLYSFLENDGEVVIPLWKKIRDSIGEKFNEKQAGQLIPEIYKSIISRYRKKLLSFDIRERLGILEITARNIENIPKSGYGGTSPLETAVRPRIEPYVDLGLFQKEDPSSHNYMFTNRGKNFVNIFSDLQYMDNNELNCFISNKFFDAVVNAWNINAISISNPNEIVLRLKKAAKIISSSSGYTPIEELALLAGIQALIDENIYFEINTARKAIITYQKANPYQVRFTVDRMGTLAHAKFMEDSSSRSHEDNII